MGSLFEFIGGYFVGLIVLTPVLLFISICAAAASKK